MATAPRTGGSQSCSHSFSLRFLSPGVNVSRRGSGFHANGSSGLIETMRHPVREECVTLAVKALTPCASRGATSAFPRASCFPVSGQRRARKCAYLVRTNVRQGGYTKRKPRALEMRFGGTTKCVYAAHHKTGETATSAHGGDSSFPVPCVMQDERGGVTCA